MADWIGIDSTNIDSYCGSSVAATLVKALNGVGAWAHYIDETHEFILDFGSTQQVTKVRGRDPGVFFSPQDVSIYVSDDRENWGAAVASGINSWTDTVVWQEIECTPKNGRYLKVEIPSTVYSGDPAETNYLAWGNNDINIFDVYAVLPVPAQPTNPSPGHGDTGVEFPTTPLSYTASDDPSADTYDIYFRIQGGVYTKIVETEDITSWRMPYNILNIKDYNPAMATGYRSPIAGDVIYDGTDSYTIAYVVRGDLINVQYQAKLYAFRTIGPGGKSPGDVLTNGVAPDVGDPQAVRVTLNDQLFFHGVVEEIYLPPDTTFEWRVDATNEAGTTEGNVWEFTTQALKIPKVSYVLIAGGSGAGPYDYPPGEEGTDWNWTGENNMMAVRRLIAAANNKIWVEDI